MWNTSLVPIGTMGETPWRYKMPQLSCRSCRRRSKKYILGPEAITCCHTPGRRCGRSAHGDPAACRAASATCNSCGRRGHYAVVCEQGARESTASADTAAAPPHSVAECQFSANVTITFDRNKIQTSNCHHFVSLVKAIRMTYNKALTDLVMTLIRGIFKFATSLCDLK